MRLTPPSVSSCDGPAAGEQPFRLARMNGFDNPTWLDPIARALSKAIARVIALDPEAPRLLAKLDGQVLEVRLSGPELSFFLLGQNGDLALAATSERDPNATLKATPGTFAALLLSGGEASAGTLELTGDALAARAFEQFFKALKPDWDEPVTQLFGDVAGVQIATGLRGMAGWLKERATGLRGDVANYFKHESRDVVSASEFEAHREAVEDLRDDLDRFEARLKRRGA
jgi:ubiquinone biosynthesis accessory factor UbiJ